MATREKKEISARGRSLWTAKTPEERTAIARFMRRRKGGIKGGRTTQQRARFRISLGSKEEPPWVKAQEGRKRKCAERRRVKEGTSRLQLFLADQKRWNEQYVRRASELFGRERVKVW